MFCKKNLAGAALIGPIDRQAEGLLLHLHQWTIIGVCTSQKTTGCRPVCVRPGPESAENPLKSLR